MKSFLFALAVLASPLSSFACPGGHLKSLTIDNIAVAEINMVDNTVKVLDASLKLDRVSLETYDVERPVVILCSQEVSSCQQTQQLGIDLRSVPNANLFVTLKQVDGSNLEYSVSDFRQTRSIGACGQSVEPISR